MNLQGDSEHDFDGGGEPERDAPTSPPNGDDGSRRTNGNHGRSVTREHTVRNANKLTNVILLTIVLVVGAFTSQALAQGDTWDTTKASRDTATSASAAGVIDGILICSRGKRRGAWYRRGGGLRPRV